MMASTSSNTDSLDDAGDDDDEVFSELTCEELVTYIKNLIRNYHSKSKRFKILKKIYDLLFDKAKTLNT